MPIHGLTERRRLPRLGKIRLGIKEVSAKTGNPYPRAVDYFVSPSEVQALYGEKPRELPICFPVEDEAQFAQQWYRRYSQSRGLTCKGDGERSNRLVDRATGDFAHTESKDVEMREGLSCPGEDCPEYQAKRCRRVMNLLFLLPEVPGLGVWQLDTSSIYSILNINSGVALVRETLGRVKMIPLVLSLIPQEVTPPGERKKTVHILQLRAGVSLIEAQRIAALPVGRVLLPAPEAAEEEEGNGQAVEVAPNEDRPEDLFPAEVIEAKEIAPLTPKPEPKPVPPLKTAVGPLPAAPGKDAKINPFQLAYIRKTYEAMGNLGETILLDFLTGKSGLENLTVAEANELIEGLKKGQAPKKEG